MKIKEPYCTAEEFEVLSKLLQEYLKKCDEKFLNDAESSPLSYEDYYLKNFNKEAEKHLK